MISKMFDFFVFISIGVFWVFLLHLAFGKQDWVKGKLEHPTLKCMQACHNS